MPAADGTRRREFGEHFGRRRVELGGLHPPLRHRLHPRTRLHTLRPADPAPRRRRTLDSIQANLESRISAAEPNNWLGDVEQLHVTRSHLQPRRARWSGCSRRHLRTSWCSAQR